MKKNTLKTILVGAFALFASFTFSQNVILMDCENNTFDQLNFTVFANGTGNSNADITIVNNPSMTGVNTSAKVGSFLRRTDASAQVYAGAFSGTGTASLDFSTNKFIHVKVLKTKTSLTKFKIEGGPSGDVEIPSTLPYTTAGVWQDMVFDFSSVTGVYPTVVFLPDFEDPLVDTGNITVYFDEIYLSSSATPDTGSLAISSNFLKSKITIYPVPVKNILTIDTEVDLASITILNTQGTTIYESKNIELGSNTMDTSSLSSGLYFVNILAQNGDKLNQKLIKI